MGTWGVICPSLPTLVSRDGGMEGFHPNEDTAPWAAPLPVSMLSVSPPSHPGLVVLVGAGAVHPVCAAPRSCSSPVSPPPGQPAAEDAAERDHHAGRSPRRPAGICPRLQSRLQPGWATVHLLQGREAGRRQGGLRCSTGGAMLASPIQKFCGRWGGCELRPKLSPCLGKCLQPGSKPRWEPS